MMKRLKVEEPPSSEVIDLTEEEDGLAGSHTTPKTTISSSSTNSHGITTTPEPKEAQSKSSVSTTTSTTSSTASSTTAMSLFPKEVSLISCSESVRFLLLDCCVTYHAEHAPVIHLLGKSADGKRIHMHVLGFNNYFYADPTKVKTETLMGEKGNVSVTECTRAPLFFHRAGGAMRKMLQVRYSFHDAKEKPVSGEGRFEIDIKLKRRFMTERKLGAGCTVRCELNSRSSDDESESIVFGQCRFDQVFRVDSDEVSSAVLRVVAIDIQLAHNPKRAITARCVPEKSDPIVCITCHSGKENQSTLFVLDEDTEEPREAKELCAGRLVTKHFFSTEAMLLDAFDAYLQEQDPDVIVGWDIVVHLESLQDQLKLSRLDASIALKSRKVVNYSAAWVRRPNARMSSTSNQQTTKLTEGIEGRIVLDLLRTTTTKHKLQRYTLAESIGHFLWEENPTSRSSPIAFAFQELDQPTISTIWRQTPDRERILEYCLGRSIASLELMRKQCLVEETLQAGSTALLTVNEVTYGAQMVRVHSLLQRKMYELDRIAAGSSDRSDGVLSDPINAPFLIDPIEVQTQGLYMDEPVAVLDFASLYPSIIIGFNLCYSTYIHDTDRKIQFKDRLPPPRKTGSATKEFTMAPAYPETLAVERHVFVTEAMSKGIVPELLKELIEQREAVKQQMSLLPKGNYQRTILDQRQTQFKLSANATYGFIGATASPLSFTAVAESVLRWGQAICRRAVTTVQKQFPECKVIYGQTDSLFVSLGTGIGSMEAAESKAKQIADAITQSIGRSPIRIKLEKIYSRLLLSGVNRYAGQLMESKKLEIVGIESESRKECGLTRKILRRFLHSVLIDRDVDPFQMLPYLMDHDIPRALPSDLILTHALWRNTVNGNGNPSASTTSSSSSSSKSSPTKTKSPTRASSSKATDAKDDSSSSQAENQPHLQVARRICAKDEDVSFVLGQRVAFIFRTHPEVKRQSDKARSPFEEPEVLPDLTLYVKHKVIPPLGRLAKLVDQRKWQELESQWMQRTWTMTRVPRGARKCLGKQGCRFLVKDSRALCERCEEEGLGAASRTHWERECDELEGKLHELKRSRQRGIYLQETRGKEYSALSIVHLSSELRVLRTVMEERHW